MCDILEYIFVSYIKGRIHFNKLKKSHFILNLNHFNFKHFDTKFLFLHLIISKISNKFISWSTNYDTQSKIASKPSNELVWNFLIYGIIICKTGEIFVGILENEKKLSKNSWKILFKSKIFHCFALILKYRY